MSENITEKNPRLITISESPKVTKTGYHHISGRNDLIGYEYLTIQKYLFLTLRNLLEYNIYYVVNRYVG